MNLLCRLGRHAYTFTSWINGPGPTTLRCSRCSATKIVEVPE